MIFLGNFFLYLPFVIIFLYIALNYYCSGKKSICIVVLGDVGRSPRMQYHALSFAREGFTVDLVGYEGSVPHENVFKSEQIQLHLLREPPVFVKYLPRLLAYIAKVMYQSITIGLKLLLLPKFGTIMLQNPPTIPTMAVAWLVCWLRGAELVIDWHNYGYTILGLTLGNTHPLVRFSKWFEHFFGRFSKFNFCVTKAMKEDLSRNWDIRAETLYDRPAEIFRETSLGEQHQLFSKLSTQYDVFKSNSGMEETTLFTQELPDGSVSLVKDRPALLISSTSWTEDEDFGILLESLEEYEKSVMHMKTLPDILCVITGKGPQKAFYKSKIEKLSWKHVRFCLPWLEAEDYPKLLGSADLGVCLHKSSSGLDLPMKVVDMFGCGLPVCAIQFDCISELVQQEYNGLIFKDAKELSEQIKSVLMDFPENTKKLASMRHNLKDFQSNRWHSSWKKIVLPVFMDKES